ncbi:MAG: TnsD family Tn7-like transposition protein [Terrisporobacter sp.]|uniref:TnsD family Tn7-like transposition protein n=1 Tax=Terrisporobacter sp. TaxID=1965305 RepID=UPI0026014CFA|nr:TnsD family Tn7-like transposition protein [uncultured Terrisporobacter sp.]
MIFFPKMYEDELLYSAIARYHIRSGNISYSYTTKDIFGRVTVKSSIYLPSNISNLVKNLPLNNKVSEMDIIMNHTLYPFYTAFQDEITSKKILDLMLSDDGSNIYNTVGICASKISIPKFLKFCTECFKEDIANHGEAYWHRVHQIECVMVCPKHKIILEDSTVRFTAYYKQEYNAANSENCIVNNKNKYSEDVIDKLYYLAKDSEYLLNSSFPKRDKTWFRNNYTNYLIYKGLSTLKGRIRQNKLVTEFKEFYGDAFLSLVQSNIEYTQTSNWLSEICRKIRYVTHPIRHLLFIRYLNIKIDDIFNNYYEFKPFGNGPWPCLNKASNHYKDNIITNVVIKYSQATHRITGKFCCECGYQYLKELDYVENGKYEKTRVLNFGQVWEDKLKYLVTQGELTISEIAEELDLDWTGLYKHIIKLGLEHQFKTTNKRVKDYEIKKKSAKYKTVYDNKQDKIKKFRFKMLEILKQNPGRSRFYIKQLDWNLYECLQNNDSEWLEKHLPNKKVGKPLKSNVDWEARDKDIRLRIEELVKELHDTQELPKKINMNRIGKTLNIDALLGRYLDKMPNTAQYLKNVIETKEDFIIRKIRWAIEKVDNDDEYLNIKSIFEVAHIYNRDKKEYKDIIQDEIDKYCIKNNKIISNKIYTNK